MWCAVQKAFGLSKSRARLRLFSYIFLRAVTIDSPGRWYILRRNDIWEDTMVSVPISRKVGPSAKCVVLRFEFKSPAV